VFLGSKNMLDGRAGPGAWVMSLVVV
jgi:hypothetical protein